MAHTDATGPQFVGIDAVVYGVQDLALCRRFFEDWGLRAESEALLRTREGPAVVLRHDPGGSAMREVVWGVRSADDLDLLERAVPACSRSPDGSLHGTDPFGNGIGFTVWRHPARAAEPQATLTNVIGSRTRISRPSTYYTKAGPSRIGHVVFEVSGPADLRRGTEFYVDLLGFKVSDRYPERGIFCRCAEENDHHNIALLTTRKQRTAFEHVAFEVRDIHEVFGGGLQFAEKGWQTVIGPGRHKVSSAYFWYFDNPAGGQVEYFSDTDFLDRTWVPRDLPPGPDSIAEWALFKGVERFKGFPPG